MSLLLTSASDDVSHRMRRRLRSPGDRLHPRLTHSTCWLDHPGDLPIIGGILIRLHVEHPACLVSVTRNRSGGGPSAAGCDQQLPGRVGADTVDRDQIGVDGGNQRLDELVEVGNLGRGPSSTSRKPTDMADLRN